MMLLVRRNAEAGLLMVSIVEVGLDKHVKKLCKEILKYLMLKLKLLYRRGWNGRATIKKPSHLAMENKDK